MALPPQQAQILVAAQRNAELTLALRRGGDEYALSRNGLGVVDEQTFIALLEDLDQRGSLEPTLVVVCGEFGRTPKVNKNGGRDHWASCYSALMAGGGVRGGQVYGASDQFAAYPLSKPVGPRDLAATILDRFGINPETEVRDRQNRPVRICRGEPIHALF